MLKMKRMAILAVVALGLVALAAPAGASAKSKSIERLNKDVQRLGNNVSDLRKKTDEMNNTIASLANTAGKALTQLEDGLVELADQTANFKYGVVQVATRAGGDSSAGDSFLGLGPQFFYATPPLYQTGEQQSVTFPIYGNEATQNGGIRLLTAVRAVDPDQGSVACRVTVASTSGDTSLQGGAELAPIRFTKVGSKATGFLKQMPQGVIDPKNGTNTANFPFGLVEGGDDKVIDLAEPSDLSGNGTVMVLAKNKPAMVTLTCIAAP